MALFQMLLTRLEGWSAFSLFQSDENALSDYEKQIAECVIAPDAITERLDQIGGLSAIKEDLKAQVLLPLQHAHVFQTCDIRTRPPRGILLHGAPGTGKTMLAKAIAAEAKRPFVSLSLASLESKWYGETSKLLQACFSFARKNQPCVLFFDEIDGLMRARNENDQSCVYGMKTEFLSHMDGMHTRTDDSFVVIACTNNLNVLDPAIKRRLPQVYKIDPPSADEVCEILTIHLRESGLKPAQIKAFSSRLRAGCTGADLSELIKGAWAERRRGLISSQAFKARLKTGTIDKEFIESRIGRLNFENLVSVAASRRLLRA